MAGDLQGSQPDSLGLHCNCLSGSILTLYAALEGMWKSPVICDV